MNISLICEKKLYNFTLPLEVSLNYIKKLSSRIFKSELLDIYYKGNKISNEEKEDKSLLKEIVTVGESNIKLKIVLNPTLSSTKNQTPTSINSSPVSGSDVKRTLDLRGIQILANSNKVLLLKNNNNKLFESIYNQKTKKLLSSINEFNKKIIEIDNFLFKKKSNNKNGNLSIFEKKLYDFIDGLRLYFRKLINALEINNYVSYKEMIQNLNIFYYDLLFEYGTVPELNYQTTQEVETITSTPLPKFPINLKKSDYNLNLNSDRGYYFNKPSLKPSTKKSFFYDINNTLINTFENKKVLVNDDNNNLRKIKIIEKKEKDENSIEKKESKKFIKLTDNEKKDVFKEDKKEDKKENNSENIQENQHENSNSCLDKTNKDKKEGNELELDLNSSSKKMTQSDLSQKSINNISSITRKSEDSNKNEENEENMKNINNISDSSKNKNNISNSSKKKSDKEIEKQMVPLNLDLINNNNSKKEDYLYKEIKVPKKTNKKPPEKNHINSTIQENEDENMTNSSYDNTNKDTDNSKNFNSTIKRIKSNKSVKSKNKTINLKNININKNNSSNKLLNFEDKKNNNNLNNIKNINKINNANNNNDNINNNQKKVMITTIPENAHLEENMLKKREYRKSIIDPPIYQTNYINENDMAKVLSRKALMKKKKSKTTNKYDFLI